MKNLLNLGKTLSKVEQKQIFGGNELPGEGCIGTQQPCFLGPGDNNGGCPPNEVCTAVIGTTTNFGGIIHHTKDVICLCPITASPTEFDDNPS